MVITSIAETKVSKTGADEITRMPKSQDANILDAASQGAASAVMIVSNIAGSLIAFLGFLAFINGVLSWGCELIGYEGITFQYLMGKIFIPLAWLMGVDNEDLELVGRLIGIKSFVNEFVAYAELGQIEHLISNRSKVRIIQKMIDCYLIDCFLCRP